MAYLEDPIDRVIDWQLRSITGAILAGTATAIPSKGGFDVIYGGVEEKIIEAIDLKAELVKRRDKRIGRMFFYHGVPQALIAKEFGISQQRVSQIIKKL